MSAPRAVLFDFNGVLVEDETYHWRAFRDVLAPIGIRLGRARYNARYLVFDDRTALRTMLRDAARGVADLERLLARKRRVYARLARRGRIDPRAAGCAVIGVAPPFRPGALRRAGARRVAPRLSALRVEQILSSASRTRPSRRRS